MRRLVRLFAPSVLLLLVITGVGPAAGAAVDPAEDVYAFGDAGFHGSTGSLELHRPIVGMAPTPTGDGYWQVASDGGIFTFGDATFHGSTGDIRLNSPIVGMAATPTGAGYRLIASDGGIFTFGDATFHGSTGDIRLNSPIVGMAATPTGAGYRLVASDGGIFTFGDATFHGSTGDIRLNSPIVGMAATPTGAGYRLVASDGGIFTFGDATFHGSTGDIRLNSPIVAMASTTGHGYWLAAADGGIFTFGDATFHGSGAGRVPYRPIVDMAATPSGGGYWLVSSGECVFQGETRTRTSAPQTDVMLLTDVRTGAHECYERVVFDFRDEQGGPDGAIDYEVSYRRPPFVDPSGSAVAVDGSAHLSVLFRSARAHTPDGREPTYHGPDEIRPDNVTFIEELQQVQDYEATLWWVIGLDQRRVFNVIELDGPDRIAIDIGPATSASDDVMAAALHFTPESSLSQSCADTRTVMRTVGAAAPLTGALQELLRGPTPSERDRGLTSWFSQETAGMLRSTSVADGTARIDFGDLRDVIPNASTSCGSAMLLAQLDRTAKQFAGVEQTVYSLEGDVDAFYEWLQRRPPEGH